MSTLPCGPLLDIWGLFLTSPDVRTGERSARRDGPEHHENSQKQGAAVGATHTSGANPGRNPPPQSKKRDAFSGIAEHLEYLMSMFGHDSDHHNADDDSTVNDTPVDPVHVVYGYVALVNGISVVRIDLEDNGNATSSNFTQTAFIKGCVTDSRSLAAYGSSLFVVHADHVFCSCTSADCMNAITIEAKTVSTVPPSPSHNIFSQPQLTFSFFFSAPCST